MSRKLISSGSPFEAKIGYSRAVVDGDWIFVSGTIGFNYDSMSISDDVVEQTEQALKNIQAALAQAGATLADVVRVLYVYPDPKDVEPCYEVLGKYFGDIRPAAMMLSANLLDPKMKVEIEVTARKQS